MGQTHENDKNLQKFITFRKSNQIEKSFRNIAVEGQQLFLFLEYHAITLLCHHMGPQYITHMILEWYAIKMGIIRLVIDWRVIFESISINFSKWFHYTIIVIDYSHLPKMEQFQMTIKGDRLVHFSRGFQISITPPIFGDGV